MRISALSVCAAALLSALLPACGSASAVEVSTKNNIGGHFEYAGFAVVPAGDAVPASAGDLSAPRAFEIIRPGQQAFSIGRLFTSCTCFQVSIDKKIFMTGERAVITLRNVNPTNGRNYPFYVQIASPLRVTLRHDAFIISDQFVVPEAAVEAAAETPAPVAEPVAVVAETARPAPVAESPAAGQEEFLTDADLLGN